MDSKSQVLSSERDFQEISLEGLGAHLLFGEICEENIKDAITFLLKANQLFEERELSLFINTIGGSCYDAFALIDLMEISRLPIKTVGLGYIMSMGVLIFAAGTKGSRIMTKNTCIMAHQFSTSTEGKFHEIMADYRSELYLKQQYIEHFKRHTSMTAEQIEDVMFDKSDRYLTPTECKKYGLVDHVIDELPAFNIDISASLKRRRAYKKKR